MLKLPSTNDALKCISFFANMTVSYGSWKIRGINKYGWHIGLRITNFFQCYTHADLVSKYSEITFDSTGSIYSKTIVMLVVVIMLH